MVRSVRTRRVDLPRAVTGDPVEDESQVGDPETGLPHVLRDLLRANDQRIAKYKAVGQDTTYWHGYGLALGDVWKCFKHLYEP